jgi:fructokinase
VFPRLSAPRLELLAGGLRNTNFRVRDGSAEEPIVLRFYDADPAGCAREAGILDLLRGDVPVPEVLHVRPERTDETPPFLVMRFVDGIGFRTLRETGDAAAIGEASYAIGRILARIGERRFPAPGLLGRGLTVEPWYVEGPDPVPKLVDLCLSQDAFRRRVDVRLAARIRSYTWSWSDRLARFTGESRLVHADFNAANLLVRPRNGHWEVAAVLDWEFAFSGSPSWDLGNFLRYERAGRPSREPQFSRGCIDGGMILAEDWRAVARVHDLVSLCEILSREQLPAPIAAELLELVSATIEERDPML